MAIQKSLTDITRIEPLTSVDRVLFHIDPENSLGDTVTAQRIVQGWIHSVSLNIKRYLDREIYIKDYTEYLDTIYNQYTYKTVVSPVWSVTSVELDSSGEFDGSEQDVNDYYITTYQDGITIDNNWDISNTIRGLKIVYSGGFAYHPVNSVFDVTNAFVADNYVVGSATNAMGKVIATDGDTATIEVLNGVFAVGDVLTEYVDLTTLETTGETGTITDVTKRSLAESYTDIVEAAEMQIRYMHQHKDDFENSGTTKEGETLRRSDGAPAKLQPEVRMMLDPYRRLTMFS